jgi:hypothetical protein
MKAITHKGEIGLVLSPEEASVLWRIHNSTQHVEAAYKHSSGDYGDTNPSVRPPLGTEEAMTIDGLLWRQLDKALEDIYKEET